jgi:amidophosphoribosyltransferase
MSENIKHECGIALIRLLKSPEYYLNKYGNSIYGLQKLHLLMQKQHNRGQDGAGIACVKFDMPPGKNYIDRYRSNSSTPIKDVFNEVYNRLNTIADNTPALLDDVQWLKENMPFTGELFLGHLRYGTFGGNSIENLHPMLRTNNWKTKSLILAGNFNMTNNDELFETLVQLGQYPLETSDTVTVMEKIGHFLDEENERQYRKLKKTGISKKEATDHIIKNIEILPILRDSAKSWDGGYVIAGMLGHGDAFVMRDPSGIRPAFYYADDEVVIAASERPVIQTAFNLMHYEVKELDPAKALIIKKDGKLIIDYFTEPRQKKSCSFERIYFSRGTDHDIYQERKNLGKLLGDTIMQKIDYDLKNTIFSYIPNTASVAFQGLVEYLNDFSATQIKEKVLREQGKLSQERLDVIFSVRPRIETIAVKDAKLRTFITNDRSRNDMVAHIYDVTYGVVRENKDTLVVLDDSIVRGTTLKQSIIKILDRLRPKKIIIVSSAPQIRYPDCYGIDMAKLNDFIAFKAAIALLKETHQEDIINRVYALAKKQENLPKEKIINYVKLIYKPFSPEQISKKIAQLVKSDDVNADVEVVFQSIENLHKAIPNHPGDWYFTGDYPTPGGNKVVNTAFINFIEKRDERAY